MRFTDADLKKSTARISPASDNLVATRRAPARARLDALLKTVTPHEILFSALVKRWPTRVVQEFEGVVPGRKYRIDIAVPDIALAIEVDGWEYHGRHLADFQRDRERQNLLTLNGWRILRFSAGSILKDLHVQVGIVEECTTLLTCK